MENPYNTENSDKDAAIVQYWESAYLQKYAGAPDEQPIISPVNHEILYNALDKIVIKTASQLTGLDNLDFFDAIERPDPKQPFPVIVSKRRRMIVLTLYSG